MKKILAFGLAAVLALGVLAGCGETKEDNQSSKTDDAGEGTQKITIGANLTPHAEILREAKKILAEEGIELEIVEIEDAVTPNTSLVEGSLDANFFQHQPYLDSFNEENKTDLVSVGAVHYEPFGIYAGKTKKLEDLPDGAKVGVPNNTTNEARALLLLEQEGLLTLKEGVGIEATVLDIVDNPKNIEFVEVAPEQLVRTLPDVDIAVINGNYAIEGGLHVKDALAAESAESVAAQTYKNIVVVQKKDENNEAIKRLVEVLQSDAIKDYINETYDGAVVPVN